MVICHINSTTHIPVQLLHFLTIILLGTGMSSAGLSQNKIRLSNPVTITVPGVEIDAISMLPDNETIAVVGGKPRGPTETDLAYTQQQPSGATVNIRSKQVRTFTNSHTVRINSVACSPDGLRLFTVSSHRDPFLRIWDVTTGKTVDSIPLNKEGGFPDFKVACFTGSQQIAVTDGKAIAVLDPTKRRQFAFSSDTLANSSVSNLAVSPGDKYIACYTFKNQLVIWDIRSKKVVYSPSLLPEDGTRQGWVIQSMFFTRNGTQLIIARRGKNDEIPN
jgi:WD40 repeat protein